MRHCAICFALTAGPRIIARNASVALGQPEIRTRSVDETQMTNPGQGLRGVIELTSYPDVVKLWLAGILMGVIRWAEVLVLGIFTYQLTGSPFTVAVIAFANAIPGALFGALVGAVSDRFDRRRLLLCALSGLLCSSTVLAFLAHTGTIALWHIAVATFLSGLTWSSEFPVRRTLLGVIAGLDRAPKALSADVAASSAMMFLGPLLGGLLMRESGLHAYYFAAMVALSCAIALVFSVKNRQPRAEIAGTPFLSSLVDGIAHVRGNPPVMGVLLITIVLNFFGYSYIAMVPVIGAAKLHAGPGLVGLLGSMEGAGAFCGLLLLTALATPRYFMRCFVTGASCLLVAVVLFSFSPWYPLALAVLFLGGLASAGFVCMQTTITFVATPPAMRSRIMGLLVVCIGFGPLGILHTGALAEWLGADVAMRLVAGEGLVAIAVCLYYVAALRRSSAQAPVSD